VLQFGGQRCGIRFQIIPQWYGRSPKKTNTGSLECWESKSSGKVNIALFLLVTCLDYTLLLSILEFD
jgi:hypothetical protein